MQTEALAFCPVCSVSSLKKHPECSVLHEISGLLNTDLTKHQLGLCVSLIDAGVDPEALALVVLELKKQAASMKEVL